MRNFVVFENKSQVAIESIYNTVANTIEENKKINQAFKHLEKGFEAFISIHQLKNVIEKSDNLTPALESLVQSNLSYYKDIVEDYSPTVSLESFKNSNKKQIALEGIGTFLNNIWKAIKNFFSRIWDWLTGKNKKTDTTDFIERLKKDTEERKKRMDERIQKYTEERRKQSEQIKKDLDETFKRLDEEFKSEKIGDSSTKIFKDKAIVEAVEEEEKKVSNDKKIELEKIKQKSQERIDNFIAKNKKQLISIGKRIPQYDDLYNYFTTLNSCIGGLLSTCEGFTEDFDKLVTKETLSVNTKRLENIFSSSRFQGIRSYSFQNIKNSTKTRSSNELFQEIATFKIPLYGDKILEVVDCYALVNSGSEDIATILKYQTNAISKCSADINLITSTINKKNNDKQILVAAKETDFKDFFSQLSSLKRFNENLNALYKEDADKIKSAMKIIDDFDKLNLDELLTEEQEVLKLKATFIHRQYSFIIKYNLKALNTAEVLIENTKMLCKEMSDIMINSRIVEELNAP